MCAVSLGKHNNRTSEDRQPIFPHRGATAALTTVLDEMSYDSAARKNAAHLRMPQLTKGSILL
jgi:hypothetical protein